MRSRDIARLAGLLCAGSIAASSPADALSQVPGPIEIGPSWAKLDGDGSASLYTTIVNHGVLADRLRGAACSGFGDAALTGLDGATQGSGPDEQGVLIEPGATARLAPSDAHLQLSHTGQAAAPGALIGCTLTFVHTGQRLVIFRVGPPGPASTAP